MASEKKEKLERESEHTLHQTAPRLMAMAQSTDQVCRYGALLYLIIICNLANTFGRAMTCSRKPLKLVRHENWVTAYTIQTRLIYLSNGGYGEVQY